MTPTERRHLIEASERATRASEKAAELLAKRDALATELADKGAKYAELAECMGITPDGVTYVLRKVRRANS
jgi:hypothetical protein